MIFNGIINMTEFSIKGGVMLKINKLFIKDSAIQNKASDAFAYGDYVNNLKMIIEHNEEIGRAHV